MQRPEDLELHHVWVGGGKRYRRRDNLVDAGRKDLWSDRGIETRDDGGVGGGRRGGEIYGLMEGMSETREQEEVMEESRIYSRRRIKERMGGGGMINRYRRTATWMDD